MPSPYARLLRRPARLIILAALSAAGLLGMAMLPRSQAARPASVFTVTTTLDGDDGACDAHCSLREAVRAANAAPGADTIVLPAGTYTLTLAGQDDQAALGDLDVLDDLTVLGAPGAAAVINANQIDRAIDVISASLSLTGVTIYNGRTLAAGGGLRLNAGAQVTLTASLVHSNTAAGLGGGGLYSLGGRLTLLDTRVTSNTVTGVKSEGAGALLSGGQAHLESATLGPGNAAQGSGGGLGLNQAAVVTGTGVTVRENTAVKDGGGILNRQDSRLTLTGSNILSNTASGEFGGGGIFILTATTHISGGVLSANRAISTSGDGGAALIFYSGTLSIENSVIGPGNTAGDDGGGVTVRSGTTVYLTNTQIISNTAASTGGGLHNDNGTLVLDACLLAGNSQAEAPSGGGGLRSNSGESGVLAVTTLRNGTIVRDNYAAGKGGGIFVLSGVLLVSDSVIGPGNIAEASGGGLAFSQEADITGTGLNVTITRSSILSNTARPPASSTSGGGGLFNSGANLTLIDSRVSGNTSSGQGGGLLTQNSTSISSSLTLSGSVLTGNTAFRNGGGLHVGSGTAWLQAAVITGNQTLKTTSGQGGGGVKVDPGGSLVLEDSQVLSNTAFSGGGLENQGGLTIRRSLIAGNVVTYTGGGLANPGGRLHLADAQVLDNRATAGDGGGLSNELGANAWLTGTVLAGNQADDAGGILNLDASLGLISSTLRANNALTGDGGGLRSLGVTASVSLRDSAVYSNVSAGNGGGLSNGGWLTATNSTFGQNTSLRGGGLHNTSNGVWPGQMWLYNVTIVANRALTEGGGLRVYSSTVFMANTLVAYNQTDSDFENCSISSAGQLISLGYNLSSDGTCPLAASGDQKTAQPRLGPLQANGGPTLTFALAPRSPGMDGGDPAGCRDQAGQLLLADQRGAARPANDACDVGAYETGPLTHLYLPTIRR